MSNTNNTQEKNFNPEMKMQSIDLNAWFGQKQALRNININIKTSSVTAIIGP
jgi:phosphate transport system ATP-binding protein